MFHCTRGSAALLAAAALLVTAPSVLRAQAPAESTFHIFLRGTSIGTERVTVERTSDGWTILSTGRVDPPIDLTIRQFSARYDRQWRPRELTIDAVMRGQPSVLRTTVDGTTATTELAGAPGADPVRRTDTIEPQTIFLPSPFIAPYEAVAARTRTAEPGTNLLLYQPGQATFTAIVGASQTEQIQTVDRIISAKRTALTFQAADQPPADAFIWADENGRLLRLQIPAQGLEVARDDMSAVSTRRLTMSRPNDENVLIPANGFSLAGTLSKPSGAQPGRLPAVILVAGSGATDRDETVAGIPIFGQLADAFADAGFMVLRYDKRGVGQSGGRVESATLNDYAEDLRAVIRAMADRKDVDRNRIALVGHSEGGSLALIAASKERRVAAVALLATIGTTGADLNLYQVTHSLERSNQPDDQRQATIELQRRIQDAVVTGKGWDTITVPDAVRRQADTPYFQSFLSYDPARIVKDVRQPLLVVQGLLDTQVPPDNADKLAALASARKRGGDAEVVKVPGVNHLLVPAKTGEVDEYTSLGTETVSPEVTGAVIDWLKKTLVAK